MEKGLVESIMGICSIWVIDSGVMVNIFSIDKDMMALCPGR
jgi:hypothetical protein